MLICASAPPGVGETDLAGLSGSPSFVPGLIGVSGWSPKAATAKVAVGSMGTRSETQGTSSMICMSVVISIWLCKRMRTMQTVGPGGPTTRCLWLS